MNVIHENGQEIPLSDIAEFRITHRSGKNGFYITAHIKEELTDQVNPYNTLEVEERKYRRSDRSFDVQCTKNKKLRELIRTTLLDKGKKGAYGCNMGSYVATQPYKRLKAEEILKEVST